MRGAPLPLDRPTACRICHERLVVVRFEGLRLYVDDGGDPGVRVARALGLPLDDESEAQPMRAPRAASEPAVPSTD